MSYGPINIMDINENFQKEANLHTHVESLENSD